MADQPSSPPPQRSGVSSSLVVRRLQVDGIRNLQNVDIEPGPGVNLFIGPNGAGKTSLLESLYCLSRGRSFLGSGRHEYLNQKTPEAQIVGYLELDGADKVVGLRRTRNTWEARAGGVGLKSLSELALQFPFCVFFPGLHRLVEDGPEARRQFLDYGVFHVEHSFLGHWQRYRATLRQRNAALRQNLSVDQISVWDDALTQHGVALTEQRETHLAALAHAFAPTIERLDDSLVDIRLQLATGWPANETFGDALAGSIALDRDQGFTSRGPHRADLRILRDGTRASGRLSRGQQKLVAVALLLAQMQTLSASGGVPVMGFDDLPSELDSERQERTLELLVAGGGQVWITGNAAPPVPAGASEAQLFHVEHGHVSNR
ncbi:MAG: DNA replication/repair protein RecF [Pseudomonadota bacterium]